MKPAKTGQGGHVADEKGSTLGWKIYAMVAGALATMVTRKVLEFGWRKVAGREPPKDESYPHAGLAEATAWAGLSAAAAAFARVAAVRKAADAWRHASGSPPPAPRS